MRFVLVHSPAVGPSTWRWVAAALGDRGHDVVVPDLTAVARAGRPAAFAAAAEAVAGDGPVVVVGHSGAGAVLPFVAARLGDQAQRVVFVDAGIPPCSGTFTVGGDFLPVLRELASDDGMLPRWSTWFGPGVVAALVPDGERRAAVLADEPTVPLAYYESSLVVPDGWCGGPNVYLMLSDAYAEDADRAESLGWRTMRRSAGGGHLGIVTDDAAVADDVLLLSAAPTAPRTREG